MASDGLTQAQFFPERGGIMTSLIMGGVERLYLHDFLFDEKITDLPGGSAFLFPVCGRVEYQDKLGFYYLNGHKYQLPIHGFSWNKAWKVIDKGGDFIELFLTHDPETLKMYPFRFEISLRYEISPGKIICRQKYKNLSDEQMPFSAGFHPYFKDALRVNALPSKSFLYNKNFTGFVNEEKLTGLKVSLDYLQINQQLFLLKKKQTEIVFADGQVLAINSSGEFAYLQLYTQHGKPFICAEPWMSFPNAINSEKGMRWLTPGEVESAQVEIELRHSCESGNPSFS